MADPTIKDLAYRGLASVLGGPVDLAAMVMRPFGYNVPEQQVVGGSEWIGKKLEDVGLVSSARAPVQEFITSMAIPTPSGLAKGAALGGAALVGAVKGRGKVADIFNLPVKSEGFGNLPLQQDIEKARSEISRTIELPTGTATITGRGPVFGEAPRGTLAEFSFVPTGTRTQYTVPAGSYMPPEHISYEGLNQEQIRALRETRETVSDAKRRLSSLIAAQQELISSSPARQVPEWAKRISEPLNTRAAGPSWWDAILKSKDEKTYQSFIDAGQDLLLLGKGSAAKNIEDVASHFGVIAKKENDKIVLQGKTGSITINGANSATPFIRSLEAKSKGAAEGGGKVLYQAALNWAANNGKQIAPDPAGITDINEIRKIGNELSSRVRTGVPVVQFDYAGMAGTPLVSELWKTEAKIANKRIKNLGQIKFDGKQFNMSDSDILALIMKSDKDFSKGVGVMTAKRAAISEFLKTASPSAAKAAAASLVAIGTPVFAMDQD